MPGLNELRFFCKPGAFFRFVDRSTRSPLWSLAGAVIPFAHHFLPPLTFLLSVFVSFSFHFSNSYQQSPLHSSSLCFCLFPHFSCGFFIPPHLSFLLFLFLFLQTRIQVFFPGGFRGEGAVMGRGRSLWAERSPFTSLPAHRASKETSLCHCPHC